jgi:hypothetical protein
VSGAAVPWSTSPASNASHEREQTTVSNGTGEIVAYKNLNTNEIHLSDGEHPDLEARPNMQRVSLDEVPPSALTAALRAKAEQGSIDQAAGDRVAGGFHDRGPGPVMATGAHYNPGGSNDATGILSRPGMRDVQIGEKPWEHPTGTEQLAARAEHDRMYPDRRGVIERGEQPAPIATGELLSPPAPEAPEQIQPPEAQIDLEGAGDGTPTTPVTVTPADDDADGDDPADPDGGTPAAEPEAEAKAPARKSTRSTGTK